MVSSSAQAWVNPIPLTVNSSLTHLGQEIFSAGPLNSYSQWTMEKLIGNLGKEICQDSYVRLVVALATLLVHCHYTMSLINQTSIKILTYSRSNSNSSTLNSSISTNEKWSSQATKAPLCYVTLSSKQASQHMQSKLAEIAKMSFALQDKNLTLQTQLLTVESELSAAKIKVNTLTTELQSLQVNMNLWVILIFSLAISQWPVFVLSRSSLHPSESISQVLPCSQVSVTQIHLALYVTLSQSLQSQLAIQPSEYPLKCSGIKKTEQDEDVNLQSVNKSCLSRGLYPPPVIPAGIRSFLWNPAESGGIKFGRQFCQIAILGTINSGGIETGMVSGIDQNGIRRNAIKLIKYGTL